MPTIGVNYGRVANDLPSPDQVVQLLQSLGVKNVKIFDTDAGVLRAFAGTGIDVSVAATNQDLATLAGSQAAAAAWVGANVQPYVPATTVTMLAVGNEVIGDGSGADSANLVPAMRNVRAALDAAGLGNIKVSTPHNLDVLGTSFPPSAGAFQTQYTSVMQSVLEFLSATGSVFMVNVYPFFAYTSDPADISLDYALFNPGAPTVYDSGSGKQYTNLFDAQVDAAVSATGRLGYGNLPFVITESGWPSAGGALGASVANAQTYNNNLVQHVLGNAGTPLRPGTALPTYIFALFNENEKGGAETERNFGLYYPNETPVYPIKLSLN